ncbi:rho guanine nucleotide exchange factor 11-like [Nothoprocta perdicaria]|uniref:rho guanine nucleotide exchange factor 11-like n=1 Tax=Nothoprocta perdicaria TaxID=30464 RepID=UPI000E1B9AC4|nr:rho guanine nucleotide exchange factor 11-like [Nothoprocta perdicaria]
MCPPGARVPAAPASSHGSAARSLALQEPEAAAPSAGAEESSEPQGEDEEEEEEELPAAAAESGAEPAGALAAEPSSATLRLALPAFPAFPAPGFAEGLAEAALEDVETLRLLLLRRLPAGRAAEPEDDVTPTPSVTDGAWPSAPGGRPAEHPEQSGEQPDAAGASGYRVVRKAPEEGAEEATPSPSSSQSENELQEGGGANVDGRVPFPPGQGLPLCPIPVGGHIPVVAVSPW